MAFHDQLTLPGFQTVKKIRKRKNGMLELFEYDAQEWRAHERQLDQRWANLPQKPRETDKVAFSAWQQIAQELMKQPLPTIQPVQVWPLGPFIGANVLTWFLDKPNPLSEFDVAALIARLVVEESKEHSTETE